MRSKSIEYTFKRNRKNCTFVLVIFIIMTKVIYTKPNSKLAMVLRKMEAAKVLISEHLTNDGKINELKGKIGLRFE